ncbi:MAG TPA: DUF5658 family protein [Steroidobacteraceae bacterium]
MHALSSPKSVSERRSGVERRKRTLIAYWRGARNPRRRDGRRHADQVYPIIDWHSARVFAVVLAILTLCVVDGVLTVMLLQQGAIEANPVMAFFLPHNLGWFAAVKLSLTAMGMLVLVACSRMKLFRTFPAEAVIHGVLLCYVLLIFHEIHLLQVIPDIAG